MKKRLDQHLADEGLFDSRSRAKAAVMEGAITVNGMSDVKPGTQVSGSEKIVVADARATYVSRGGLKLEHALKAFEIDPGGKVALDAGCSTGGFTDCLLQAGASKVIAVDVGRGVLHWKLRNDPRVSVLEGFNVRQISRADLPCVPRIAVLDLSFISLTVVLEPVFRTLESGAEALALVKPQFEAGREMVGKGGVVRDRDVHLQVLINMAQHVEQIGLVAREVTTSPIRGPKGNVEFFLRIATEGEPVAEAEFEREVRRAHE